MTSMTSATAKELPAQELRVLGCLVEKQLTTPQQYPLTLNALTSACNQTSNRDPVVSYDERSVEAAVTSTKTRGLARFVHPSHGRSAIRYAHTLEEALGLDQRQLALMAVLMLRGPQTAGELRTRTERMADFDGLSDLERELGRLAERDDPLVVCVGRRPGQKEDRFAHLIGDSEVAEAHAAQMSRLDTVVEAAGPTRADMRRDLASELEQLREEVSELRRQLEELRESLGT